MNEKEVKEMQIGITKFTVKIYQIESNWMEADDQDQDDDEEKKLHLNF